MKAALLLGLNCGYGTGDIAGLPLSALDLENGWADFPRSKTAIMRRCPLWPETVAAVKEALADRPTPRPGCEHLVFLRTGQKSRGATYNERGSAPVTVEFAATCKAAGVMGRTFYDARRSFQTVAETSKDFPAVSAVMGHVQSAQDMSAIYRQRISDDRLLAVVETVRRWLWPAAGATGPGQEQAPVDPLAVAVARCREAIDRAEGPTRRTLESVWLPELQNAAEHPRGSAADRLLEVWGAKS